MDNSTAVPDLTFQVAGVDEAAGASPHLALKLRILSTIEQPIDSIALTCQVQIEAARRNYQDCERERLFDLFGPPQDWRRTMRRLPWARVSARYPGFLGTTIVDLAVPCSEGADPATAKYFAALEEGDVPLRLFFRGTVFYLGRQGQRQMAPIPWDKEAQYRLPEERWHGLLEFFNANRSNSEGRSPDGLHAEA